MESKSKAEKLFVILIIFSALFAALSLTGCNSSCLDWGCESESGKYCLGGVSCASNSCISCNTCTYICGNVDYEIETSEEEIGGLSIMSCDNTTIDCTGKSSCYNACFIDSCNECGSCENCGVVCGSKDDDQVDEKTVGCLNGQMTCGESHGIWNYLLEYINEFIGIGGN